jgi:hypothetical protein
MVIDNFNVPRLTLVPSKAYPPLVIDADAMLSRAVAVKSFQAIARQRSQIVQPVGRIDGQKLCTGSALNLVRQIANRVASDDCGRSLFGEAPDHGIRAYR